MIFTRAGFMITAENFVGNPGDKTLYGESPGCSSRFAAAPPSPTAYL
ncbi:Uncharacterized protein dnm_071690 [Desulfonema magnum]|uniref:Uncharacterized protein n=1 Tax=Desulfonema magnum TaxID=45655 RepID=A0A975BTR5_9BACT|nr:Uncharacterized protein dnm_071690 [Desulfonema magnum]